MPIIRGRDVIGQAQSGMFKIVKNHRSGVMSIRIYHLSSLNDLC